MHLFTLAFIFAFPILSNATESLDHFAIIKQLVATAKQNSEVQQALTRNARVTVKLNFTYNDSNHPHETISQYYVLNKGLPDLEDETLVTLNVNATSNDLSVATQKNLVRMTKQIYFENDSKSVATVESTETVEIDGVTYSKSEIKNSLKIANKSIVIDGVSYSVDEATKKFSKSNSLVRIDGISYTPKSLEASLPKTTEIQFNGCSMGFYNLETASHNLKVIAAYLKINPKVKVNVIGHVYANDKDPKGTGERVWSANGCGENSYYPTIGSLMMARASAVESLLILAGVSPHQIQKLKGTSLHSEMNRRVSFEYIKAI